MSKPLLRYISIAFVIVLFILNFCVPRFIDKPQKIYKLSTYENSVRLSGLSPKSNLLLRVLIIAVIISLGILFFYFQKVGKSLTCEKDVFRFCRYWIMWRYLLFVAISLASVQTILAFCGLLQIEHITVPYIFHSQLFDGLGVLSIFVSFFIFMNDYINSIQKVKPSIFIIASNKNNS
jgi:hypothetical protein